MSDQHLDLARQDAFELDDSSSDSGVSNPVDKDEELVRRAQNDDPWAIEQLVLRYQKKVYQIAYQMLAGDEQEAQDLTQDTFLKAFRNIKRFKGNASFYTWLYRIVVNTCLDARRRRRRWKEIFFPWRLERPKEETCTSSLEDYPDPDKNANPLSMAGKRQLEQDLKKVMNTLSERQRDIFELKIFHEMSIPEIAQMMNLAEGTVKTHLFRATQVIQKKLKGWTDG
ncbi:MAG: sigma-70 family RNA polymerase sigma factor [Desulfobacterales bacterium]